MQHLMSEIHRFDPQAPIGSALTPPASWYTQADFFQLEKERVFKLHWQFVGRSAQIEQPGDYFTGLFMGWPYVVVRTDSGEIQAYYNVCSHHGTCIAKGEGNCEQFVCPYHGWTYNLDGALKRAPRAGAIAGMKNGKLNLKPIHTAQWGPFIALHFGEPRQQPDEALAPLLNAFAKDPFQGMTFQRRVTYEIPCNWKVYVDNYLDGGYHVPHMHPDLSSNLDLNSYQTTLGDHWSMQACGGKTDDRVGEQADYAWVYPNFMLDRYGPWLNTICVIPLDINRCLTVMDYFHEGPVPEAFLEESLKASDKVQQEDIQICHMVQTGLKSGVYEQGVYAPRFEGSMLQFHRLLSQDFNANLP